MHSEAGKKSEKKLSKVVMTALFAALTCAGCFIQIPLPGGVPVVIQDMMAMLSGLLLGPLFGSLSVCIFLLLGCAGFPVFSGKAGIQIILQGVTGGFLVGYLFGALTGGLILQFTLRTTTEHSGKMQAQWQQWLWIIVAAIAATVVLFICGSVGFMRVTGSGLAKTLLLVLIPFIPGNVIKLGVMVLLTKKFRPVVCNYLG
jgi:biotin transport system substrate-specific component